MGLNEAQLNRLDREMDANHREVLIMDADELEHMARAHQTEPRPPTQAPGMCATDDATTATTFTGQIDLVYQSTVHAYVNTAWGTPAALGAVDMVNAVRFVRDMGGIDTKIRYTTHNGRRYVVISGYPGLRQRLTGTRYLATNPRLIEMGIGRYGMRDTAMKGLKLSVYVSVGVEALEWIFADQPTMMDLFGGIGVELVKAGIATAVGFAFASLVAAVSTFAVAPLAAGAIMVLAVGVALNWADGRYGIKQKVKEALNYAVERSGELYEKFRQFDLGRQVETLAKRALAEIVDAAAEATANEVQKWILRQLPPGSIPEIPFGPIRLSNIKFPKL